MRSQKAFVVALCLCTGFAFAQTVDALGAQLNASQDKKQHDKVLELELPALDGTRILRLSSYAGRPTVLNFWGSYCPPCVAEMPMLMTQALNYPNVQFLGVAVDDRLKARSFLQSLKVTYPQMVAPVQSEGIMRRFGDASGALPYTVVLDMSHRVCRSKVGGIDSNWLADTLRNCNPSKT